MTIQELIRFCQLKLIYLEATQETVSAPVFIRAGVRNLRIELNLRSARGRSSCFHVCWSLEFKHSSPVQSKAVEIRVSTLCPLRFSRDLVSTRFLAPFSC